MPTSRERAIRATPHQRPVRRILIAPVERTPAQRPSHPPRRPERLYSSLAIPCDSVREAAWTMATMPTLTGSGRPGHKRITACKSPSSAALFAARAVSADLVVLCKSLLSRGLSCELRGCAVGFIIPRSPVRVRTPLSKNAGFTRSRPNRGRNGAISQGRPRTGSPFFRPPPERAMRPLRRSWDWIAPCSAWRDRFAAAHLHETGPESWSAGIASSAAKPRNGIATGL